MGRIKVGIIGVGNCFSGLYQGLEYYKRTENTVVGVMNEKLGEYSWRDIEFVSAWDVSKHKVGKELSEAQYAKPNFVDYIKDMPKTQIIVKESPKLDGVGKYVEDWFDPINQTKSTDELRKDIINEIKYKEIDVIVNYLPVGSQKAVEFWADICLETKTAFVNCMPVFIASNGDWHNKFKQSRVPVIGDDIKSQVGATIIHRVLSKLCDDRGAKIKHTYQLNVGGNTDFKNMLERERVVSKKVSKTESVQSQLTERLEEDNIHIGPSDFIPFLKNTKICFIKMEAESWANVPFKIDLKLEVDDKANSGGIVVDAIRLAKIAKDRNIGGSIDEASAYLFKHPRVQYSDSEAKELIKKFVEQA
ncbi:inositol-3-phosphate synthase [Candidatus Micrarchaeota archaeon]|nr:inositol-3-phosphate synthase [Candidatus Micrarchaeota archaeon]